MDMSSERRERHLFMCRILVVEDNQDERESIVSLLSHAGYECISASGVREALRQQSPYIDIVLLDYHLPDGNGGDVIKRWLSDNLHTHFVVVSGDDTVPRVVEMMKNGATDYLSKPFDTDKLLSLVSEISQQTKTCSS